MDNLFYHILNENKYYDKVIITIGQYLNFKEHMKIMRCLSKDCKELIESRIQKMCSN